jgi:2-methylisocitrate lyase-like PEP mutase family enzyme/predicted thioesterase
VPKAIPLGVRAQVSETVEFRHTLTAVNPALPPVYSTPNMIRLMEHAAFRALQPYCEGDEITVGTAINVDHRAAATIGARIEAEATLESFDGRFYTLRVSAREGSKEIGRGTVGRAVVSVGQFRARLGRDGTSKPPGPAFTPGDQRQTAQIFRALHHGPEILLLVNAWDAASARLVEQAGFPAIATTSAGIAFALGYPDGQKISRTEMLNEVARVARAVKLPVSADVEAGYGSRPEDAATTASAVIEAGAVGMNLEDGTGDPESPLAELSLQVEKVRAVREAAEQAKIPLVLNARTDVYLRQFGPPEKRFDETLRRLAAFRDAGADCLFAPGLEDPELIGRLVRELRAPVNILARPGLPPIPELQRLRVARVSLGSGPMRASYSYLRKVSAEIKGPGTYSSLEDSIAGPAFNELMRQ